MILMSSVGRMVRVCVVGAMVAAVSGCAAWMSLALDRGLTPLTKQVAADGPLLRFEFELGDDAGSDDAVLGAGYIVVSQDGKEIQALPHVFEMPKDAIPRDQWLTFQDFNGDGYIDFLVKRVLTEDTGQAITSLYQMDVKTGKFLQVEPLSNVGDIAVALPGCVQLRFRDDQGTPRQHAYCYASKLAKWVRQPGSGSFDVPDLAVAGCKGPRSALIACRKSRIELDRQLLALVRDVRNGRRDSLQREVSKGYATAYVKHMDRTHRIWLLYRDSRCTTELREQAVAVSELGAATESCRFERAREQLSSYQKRLAHLTAALVQ